MTYTEKLAYLVNVSKQISKQKGRSYPVSNQIIRCCVVSPHPEVAAHMMQAIGAAPTKNQGVHPIEWELDGEKWIYINGSDSCRGFRCYKCFLDTMTDLAIIQDRILPMCANYCCDLKLFDSTQLI